MTVTPMHKCRRTQKRRLTGTRRPGQLRAQLTLRGLVVAVIMMTDTSSYMYPYTMWSMFMSQSCSHLITSMLAITLKYMTPRPHLIVSCGPHLTVSCGPPLA